MNKKTLKISEGSDIINMMNKFELKVGHRPVFIVTTEEKRKVIMEWFGFTPDQIEDALGYSIKNIPVVTPRDIMII